MSDIVFGGLIYIPSFFKAFLGGFALWLIVRGGYSKALYSGFWKHPNLIDVCLLILWIYVGHCMIGSVFGG